MPKIVNNADRRVAVNVNLTVGLLEQVDRYVAERGLSRSALIRDLLEDAMDIAISEERLKEPRIPWETVKAEAGL
jgi:metal-responsive CopG/Arc/MetJ family transcriptional regulator